MSRRRIPRRARAFFALVRPVNCLITALSVCVGGITSGAWSANASLLLAACSAALIAGAGNAFNDLTDLEIDRINRPDRPLPAGRLTPGEAGLEALALSLLGWGLSWGLSLVHAMIAGSVVVLLFIYSKFLKNSVLWGNVAIAFTASAAFPYGALAVGGLGRSWVPAGFAFLFHLGREIVKDIEDVRGDRARRIRTLPLRWGGGRAALLASAVYLVLVGFTLLPWMLDLYGEAYLVLVGLVDLIVVYALVDLYRRRALLEGDSLSRLLKAGMFAGLLAIAAGELSL